MGKLITDKVKAATLVETIVALVIILVITGITVTVFVRVTATGFSMKQMRAASLLNRYSMETKKQKSYFDEEFREGDFLVKKQVLENSYSEDIVWIKLSVYDPGNQLIKYQNVYLSK